MSNIQLKLRLFIGLASLAACASNDADDTGNSDCELGRLDCPCDAGLCLQGLVCETNVCALPSGDGDTGDGDTGDGNTGDGNTGDGDTGDGDTGDGDTGDGDTGDSGPCGENQIFCGGSCIDPLTDNDNCGNCDNSCIVSAGEGGCAAGSCAPTWSECVASAEAPAKSCDEVCGQETMQCAAESCGNASVAWYVNSAECEIDNKSAGWANNDCGAPMDNPAQSYYRCCCQQP